MFSILNKAYPYTGNVKKYLVNNFCIAAFVAFFLIVFKPFGINDWETNNKTLKLAGFGLVSFIVPFTFNLFTFLIIAGKKAEDKWNVWKEVVSVIIVISAIALGNLIYGKMLGIMDLSFSNYIGTLISTSLIGIFPITLLVLTKQRILQKSNQLNADEINKQFYEIEEPKQHSIHDSIPQPIRETAEVRNDQLTLIAENEKDKLELAAEQLLYIESADNYSNVVYLEHKTVKKLLIRSSLKRLEGQINSSTIVRCHRTFIINLSHVSKVEGNAAGYQLSINHSKETIPVSRNYGSSVIERLRSLQQ